MPLAQALMSFMKTDSAKAVCATWTLAKDLWRFCNVCRFPSSVDASPPRVYVEHGQPSTWGRWPTWGMPHCDLYGHWARDYGCPSPLCSPTTSASAPPVVRASSPLARDCVALATFSGSNSGAGEERRMFAY